MGIEIHGSVLAWLAWTWTLLIVYVGGKLLLAGIEEFSRRRRLDELEAQFDLEGDD